MNTDKNLKTCKDKLCDNKFIQFSSLKPYCSYECEKRNKKVSKKDTKTYVYKKRKPINKESKKQSVISNQYSADRIVYLGKPENQICFIDGCNEKANTVEHTRGRGKGFFDKEAELKGVCKTLDQRFWKPCCLHHNLELERDGELSKKYQLSKLHGGKKL